MQNIQTPRILQTLALLTFIALVTLLPSVQFMPKSIIWFNDRQRLLELLLLSFVLLDTIFIGLTLPTKQTPITKKVRNVFFVLLGLTIVSCSLAQSPRHSLVEASVFAGLCYLALFIARLFNENKQIFLNRITYALWASILLYMLSFYTGYVTATIFKTPLQWPFPFTGFSNIRSFNQYQLWTIGLICIPLLNFSLTKAVRAFLYLGLILWWVLLFYSASRGVLLAWLFGVLITAIVYRKSSGQFLRLQTTCIILGFGIYYLLFNLIPAANESTLIANTVIRHATNDRIALWNQALMLIQQSPIFGVGPMHYAWHNGSNGHPHNSVLQLACEWGLPATFIIISLAGYAIYCWVNKFRKSRFITTSLHDRNLEIALFFTIGANAAYSLVDGVIVSPISQVLMFTVIGIMLGYFYSTPNDEGNSNQLKSLLSFNSIAAFLVLSLMAWSTFPEIRNGLSGNEKGFSMGYSAAGPRLWHETK